MIENYSNPNSKIALEHSKGGDGINATLVNPERKTYATPMLMVHGQFERMTLQVSGTGNAQSGDDGGTNP